MTRPLYIDPRKKLADALADPVLALRQSRYRYRTADQNYRKILYEELSVVFAAHKALMENSAKWAEYAKCFCAPEDDPVPEEPTFPESLHIIVNCVFGGRQSPNRAHKYARALEELHHNNVDPKDVVKMLRDKGIDRFYAEATENHPRRAIAPASGEHGPAPTTHAIASPLATNPNADVSRTDRDQADEDTDDWAVDEEPLEAEQTMVNSTDTLWLRIAPPMLARVLAMEVGQKGSIEMECVGLDREGWKLFDARRFERARRP